MEIRMKELIDQKNWSETPLGHPDNWPTALKTLLGVMLNSRFPMFLFWGPELISFYNDAFRPSLGQDGKHPHILGAPAHEAWKEIWSTIKPMLDQALSGDPIWNEYLLVPFYRNGRIEDIYWTFSYSPIYDDAGNACGVMVICNETTEKVLQSARLTENENRFRNVVYQAPIGIAILRGENLIVEMANKTYLEIIGRSEKDLVGKGLFEGLPEVRPSVEKILLNVLRTGTPYYGNEFKVPLKRGGITEDTFFNFVYYPLRDTDHTISGIIVVASEVTEQVRAKYRVQESEQKFRQLLMSMPIPTSILKGEDFVIEMANHALVDSIWHRPYSEVIGKKLFDVFSELKDQPFFHLLRNVFSTGQPHSQREAVAFLRVSNELKRLILDYEYTPLFDDANRVWGVMVTLTDITEKFEARKKVEESEERLNIVINASGLGTWEVNFKTKQVQYSDRYLEMLGYNKPVELTHEQILKHLHPDDSAIREQAYKRAMETGVLQYAARVIWNDNSVHWIEGKGKLFYDVDGQPERMLGTLQDITREKSKRDYLEQKVEERTQELARQNAELARMNAELQSFAYVSSHDLQEPLRKIQTLASRIKETEILSEKNYDYFQRIQNSAHQMQVLIQDLLAYSRADKHNQKFTSIDLCTMIHELQFEFAEALDEKQGVIQIENTIGVHVIQLQFRQLLHNLISNSLKFSKPGVPLVVKISAQAQVDAHELELAELPVDGHYCSVTVTDNGIGIDPQYTSRIFEVFQRLHGKHEYSGTGIGLAIVKRIAENHRGKVNATSKPGAGASFTIYLPASS